MTDKRAFYFRCAESVPGNVEDVIDSANDPEITVFVAAGAVSGEIVAFNLAPVLLTITGFVAVDRAQHRRPRAANDQLAANIRAHFECLLIDHGRIAAKERKRGATGLGRDGPRKRRN